MQTIVVVVCLIIILYLISKHIYQSSNKIDMESQLSDGEEGGKIYEIANELADFYYSTAHPKDLLKNDIFIKGVKHLNKSNLKNEDLIKYGAGNNEIIASMALEVIH